MNNVIVIVLMLIASAFFSGMEIAYLASNKLRLELDKKQGLLSSRIINIFQSSPGQFIATILLGNNLALVVYGIFMARSLNPFFVKYITSDTGLLAVQTLLSTFVVLLLAEFLPKAVVRINPNKTLTLMSVPLLLVYIIFYPASRLLHWFSGVVMRKAMKDESAKEYDKMVFGKVDLDYLISESHDESEDFNQEEKNEIRLFQNALDFANVKVRDCMIPRPEITAVEVNTSVDELRQRFIETGFSKILIYEENIDNITGYITSKELFKSPDSLRKGLLEVSYVAETMPASKLLRIFIKEHKSVAVVVDEFGGISGMLTIEDIIEEIFGEIDDEHDVDAFIEKDLGEERYIFSGRLEIDYLNEKYRISVPESEEYGTLAGFIIYHSGSIPKMNDNIRIGNFDIKILKVSHTRIELVQFNINPESGL
ncbi:MAG: HlyC/CorC family transporter [Bacteroidales bacterium]|nr:HlyC/CorC family transporter [Bacteroidales bacterium]